MPYQDRRSMPASTSRAALRAPRPEPTPAGPNRTEELHRRLFSDYRPAPRTER